jgi:hypothetical protein
MNLVKAGAILLVSAVGCLIASVVVTYLHGDPPEAGLHDPWFLVLFWGSLVLFFAAPLLAVAAVALWTASALMAIRRRLDSSGS